MVSKKSGLVKFCTVNTTIEGLIESL